MPSMVPPSFIETDVNRPGTGQTNPAEPVPSCATRVHGESPVGAKTLLFATNASGFGGSEKHLLELIKRLRRSGVRLYILEVGADVHGDHLEGSDTLDVGIRREKIQNSFWDWFRFFRTTRPDIVVFVNGWIRSFPWYASVAACLAGVPRRFAIYHTTPPPLAKVEGRSMRSLLRRLFGGRRRTRLVSSGSALFFNAAICVSNAGRDRLVIDYRFPSKKTITIYNGVSVSEFVPSEGNRASVRARLGLGSEEFLLVCVSRLSKEKGVDTLLMALTQVLRQGVGCKCIIVGDGPLRKPLLEQAEALGLNDHVFFEGFHKDVRPFLQAADAFVLTSHTEGFSLSILEAMACGLPCVVTNVGGNAEAVHHMVHGMVVAPGSVHEVADAISYLGTHPRERTEMSKVVRVRVREAFDLEDRMSEIKRVILN
jgi:glycosyltransferase involved in cell wall biosynthesis